MTYAIVLMGDNFIGKVFDEIQERVGGFFGDWIDFFFSPLWLWWGIGVGVFLVVLTIAFFLPFKWVRATLGAGLVLGGAFLFGGTTMYRTQRRALEDERAKRKALEKQLKEQRRAQPRTGWFS